MRAALPSLRILLTLGVMSGVATLPACGQAPEPARHDESVLRIVPLGDLTILDPVYTPSDNTLAHGYLVYDTLFGTDAAGLIAPQMVDTYDVSPDRKTWTFTLRSGLEFHDGAPVTGDDVIASLQRWSQRDVMGQRLASFAARWEPVNATTFRLVLKAPYGFVLESLGKPVSNVPFIMPKRIADTPVDKQITDTTGSGPFIFSRDEWLPGERVVYLRNPRYQPRQEPASGTAGGKVAKVDRIEWVIIEDPQTQISALTTGTVDMIVSPAQEHYPVLRRNPDIRMFDANPYARYFQLAMNHTQAPFDQLKVRQAAMAAMNQLTFLQTQVGVPGMYRVCLSIYACGTPYETTAGFDVLAKPDPLLARKLLKESGYGGEPVILLGATAPAAIAKLPAVAANLLRQAGFVVDLQSMDFTTLRSRRARKEGWNLYLTAETAPNSMNPLVSSRVSGACAPINGWYCDPELETQRDAFAAATDAPTRKALAERIQMRIAERVVFVPLGEFSSAIAVRKNITGLVPGLVPVLWNVEKH